MSEKEESARRIQETMRTAGWRDIDAIFREHIKVPLDELYEIMVHKTGSVTGAGAHLRAGKSRGCSDLYEDLMDRVRSLPENAE